MKTVLGAMWMFWTLVAVVGLVPLAGWAIEAALSTYYGRRRFWPLVILFGYLLGLSVNFGLIVAVVAAR